jgi:hypothetical protein
MKRKLILAALFVAGCAKTVSTVADAVVETAVDSVASLADDVTVDAAADVTLSDDVSAADASTPTD